MAPDEDEPDPAPASPVDPVRSALSARAGLLAEGALLVAAFSWMLWVRLKSLENMERAGTVLFAGTDPYYHFRNLLVAVHRFPASLDFDPWTYFPVGTASGQFGTLFETVLAGAVLLAHGGSVPDVVTLRRWAAVYPTVLGALTVLPVYVFVRRATNRVGAAYAAVALSFLSGEFLVRSLAGYFDHHVAEALLSAAAAAGLLAAIQAADRRLPDLEGLWRPLPGSLDEARDRLRGTPRRPSAVAALAAASGGFLLALYLLVWNYGILFIVIFDLFAVVAFVLAVRRDRRTDGLTLATAGVFLAAALLVLPSIDEATFSLHTQSLLQPTLLLLSALGVLVLQGLRVLVGRAVAGDLDVGLPVDEAPPSVVYSAATTAAVLVGAGLVALLLPDLFHTLGSGWDWVVGAGEGSRVKTIAEAQGTDWSGLVDQVGWMAYPATVAVALAGWRAWTEADPASTLVVVWGAAILVATFSQVRFSYYAGVVTVVLNGYLMGSLARQTGLAHRVREVLPDAPDPDDDPNRRASTAAQVGVVLLVAAFLLPGLVVATDDQPSQAWKVGDRVGPGESAEWQPALEWMRANTPPIDGLDLTENHDGPGDYPEGSYGVLSWWDYGHWIQVNAERPPVANPFQQAAPFASEYFTEDPQRSTELLEDWEGEERVRYVMIDDAMATGKFSAITVWAERTDLNEPAEERNYTIEGQTIPLPVLGEPFAETTLFQLYFADADGLARYRLVHELTGQGEFRFVGNVLRIGDQGASLLCFHQTFPSRRCQVQPATGNALELAARDEPVPVQTLGGQRIGYAWDVHYVSSLKTFERVEGAVLTGDAPAGSTVNATVQMASDGFRSFTYNRSTSLPTGTGNTTFELRVPYATGPPEPPANRTVTAQGPYQVTVEGPDGQVLERHQVQVPDRAVLQGETVPVGGSG